MKRRLCICIWICLLVLARCNSEENGNDTSTDYVIIFDASQTMGKILDHGDYAGSTKLEAAKHALFDIFFGTRQILDSDSIHLIILADREPRIETMQGTSGTERMNELRKRLDSLSVKNLGHISNISSALRLSAAYFYNYANPSHFHCLVVISDGIQTPVNDDVCTTAEEIGNLYETKLVIHSWIWFGIVTENEKENLITLGCIREYLPHGTIVDASKPEELSLIGTLEEICREIHELRLVKQELETFNSELQEEEKILEDQVRDLKGKLESRESLFVQLRPLIHILCILLILGVIMITIGLKFYFK